MLTCRKTTPTPKNDLLCKKNPPFFKAFHFQYPCYTCVIYLNSNSWVFNLAAVLPSNFLETPSTSHELLLAKPPVSTIFTGWLTRIPPLRPGSFFPWLTLFGHQFPSYLSSRIELINIHSGFRAKTQKKGEECAKCEIDAIHSWKTHENIIGFCAKRLDTRRLIGFLSPAFLLLEGIRSCLWQTLRVTWLSENN